MSRGILIFLLLLISTSCHENEEFKYLSVVTRPVDYTSGTDATFTGIIENKSRHVITESGFILSIRSLDTTGLRLISSDPNQESLSQQTTSSLLPGKTYYIRAYVVIQGSTIYGNEVSFKTSGEVNIGHWTDLVQSNQEGFCQWVGTVFSIGDNSYFLLGEDGMYRYNHPSKVFTFIEVNNVVKYATHSFVYNGDAFLFHQDRFYKYNPTDNTLEGLSIWPAIGPRGFSSAFIIDAVVYIGLGQHTSGYVKDFWKYDLERNTWERIADFPGEFRSFGFSFALNNQGFIGGGYNLISPQWPYPKFEDLWQYNPQTNQWIKKESLPFNNDELFDLISTENTGKGYCFYKKKFYEYNSIYNFWEPMANLSTSKSICYPILFSHNNKVFLAVLSSYSDNISMNMWVYEK